MNAHLLEDRLREIAQRKIDRGTSSVKLIASKTGLSESTVSNWLHGKRSASMNSLAMFIATLDLEVELMPAQNLPTRERKK